MKLGPIDDGLYILDSCVDRGFWSGNEAVSHDVAIHSYAPVLFLRGLEHVIVVDVLYDDVSECGECVGSWCEEWISLKCFVRRVDPIRMTPVVLTVWDHPIRVCWRSARCEVIRLCEVHWSFALDDARVSGNLLVGWIRDLLDRIDFVVIEGTKPDDGHQLHKAMFVEEFSR